MESGKFAVNLVVLEVYSRAVAATRGLSDAHARHLSSGLSQAFAANGGFISPDAIRQVTAMELGGASPPPQQQWGAPPQMGQSSTGRAEDPYFGSGGGVGSFSPSNFSGGGGGGGGQQGGSGGPGAGFGSPSNPLVVSVAPGRAGMLGNIIKIFYIGLACTMVYQVFFNKGGGLAGPLAQLTGDIVEEVTDVPTTRFSDVKVRGGAATCHRGCKQFFVSRSVHLIPPHHHHHHHRRAWTRPSRSWRTSWHSCATPKSSAGWAPRCPGGCCSRVHQVSRGCWCCWL